MNDLEMDDVIVTDESTVQIEVIFHKAGTPIKLGSTFSTRASTGGKHHPLAQI